MCVCTPSRGKQAVARRRPSSHHHHQHCSRSPCPAPLGAHIHMCQLAPEVSAPPSCEWGGGHAAEGAERISQLLPPHPMTRRKQFQTGNLREQIIITFASQDSVQPPFAIKNRTAPTNSQNKKTNSLHKQRKYRTAARALASWMTVWHRR